MALHYVIQSLTKEGSVFNVTLHFTDASGNILEKHTLAYDASFEATVSALLATCQAGIDAAEAARVAAAAILDTLVG